METRPRKLAPGVSRLVRLPRIAPGRAPWQGAILLLNHNREIKRAGSVIAPPARAISIKNKHLLVIYSIPTRGFTAAVSVFRGTPPAKPLDCKIQCGHSGALSGDQRADPVGGEPRLSRALFRFVSADIFKMPCCSCSQFYAFRCCWFHFGCCMGKQKTLLPFRQAGCKIVLGSFTCLPSIYPSCLRDLVRELTWIGRG